MAFVGGCSPPTYSDWMDQPHMRRFLWELYLVCFSLEICCIWKDYISHSSQSKKQLECCSCVVTFGWAEEGRAVTWTLWGLGKWKREGKGFSYVYGETVGYLSPFSQATRLLRCAGSEQSELSISWNGSRMSLVSAHVGQHQIAYMMWTYIKCKRKVQQEANTNKHRW